MENCAHCGTSAKTVSDTIGRPSECIRGTVDDIRPAFKAGLRTVEVGNLHLLGDYYP